MQGPAPCVASAVVSRLAQLLLRTCCSHVRLSFVLVAAAAAWPRWVWGVSLCRMGSGVRQLYVSWSSCLYPCGGSDWQHAVLSGGLCLSVAPSVCSQVRLHDMQRPGLHWLPVS